MDDFFSPNEVQTSAQVQPKVKLLGGMQMHTMLKSLGRIQSNYWGENIPPSGFGTPVWKSVLVVWNFWIGNIK